MMIGGLQGLNNKEMNVSRLFTIMQFYSADASLLAIQFKGKKENNKKNKREKI